MDNIFERNPKKTLGLALIIVITAIDISAAQIYKLIAGRSIHQQVLLEETARIEKTYRISSNIYHHDLQKSMSVANANWGNIKHPVFTDSLGFKSGSIHKTLLSAQNRRIVFIGDSFTEGVGVEYPDTFVGIIANQLAGEKIEVLNAAVASYSPIIYWRKIKYLIEEVGLKFDELIVFIDISDVADDVLKYRLSDHNNVESTEEFTSGSGAIPTIKTIIKNNTILIHWLLDKTHDIIFEDADIKGKYDIGRRGARWTVDKTIFDEFGQAGLKKNARFMGLLHDLLKKHHITLLIGVYPWPDQIVENDLNSVQVTFWQDWAKERNVRLVNFFPYFIKNNASRKANYKTLDEYFIKQDAHWNEKGHQLIADSFLSFYRNKK